MNRPRRLSIRRRMLLTTAVVVAAVLGLGATTTVDAQGGRAAAGAQTACTAPAWSASASYPAGAVVSHRGHEWRANQMTWPGLEPGDSGVPPWWVPWADLGPCAPATTTTTQPPGSTTTTSTPGSTTTTTAPPGQSVEAFYAATGPWAVTTGSASAPGTPGVALYYPTNLGADGHRHPVVTWANGLNGQCGGVADTLGHLASWGFVVVCPETGEIVPEHVLAAAHWALSQHSDPSSVFHGKLDTADIGAIGHSRGSGTSLAAGGREPDLFTTIVALNFTDRWTHGNTEGVDALRRLARTSVFFAAGTADFLVTESEQRFFFDTAAGPAVRAAVVGAGHNLIGAPDNAFQPYLTAWLKYTLEGDQFARQAFVGNPPEINADPGWAWQQQKNLP
jgi:hypothetical protein